MLKSQSSERIQDADIFWSWWEAMELGLEPDFRKDVFNELERYGYQEMQEFFRQVILHANSNLLILGNRDAIDRRGLETLGEMRELSPEELFGY